MTADARNKAALKVDDLLPINVDTEVVAELIKDTAVKKGCVLHSGECLAGYSDFGVALSGHSPELSSEVEGLPRNTGQCPPCMPKKLSTDR